VLAKAIKGTGNLLEAAKLRTDTHDCIIARIDIARRVEASPELQHTYEAARTACMQRAVASAMCRRLKPKPPTTQPWRNLQHSQPDSNQPASEEPGTVQTPEWQTWVEKLANRPGTQHLSA
jgi:hypothetical protein